VGFIRVCGRRFIRGDELFTRFGTATGAQVEILFSFGQNEEEFLEYRHGNFAPGAEELGRFEVFVIRLFLPAASAVAHGRILVFTSVKSSTSKVAQEKGGSQDGKDIRSLWRRFSGNGFGVIRTRPPCIGMANTT
jgi:hypothetical protein